MRGSKQIHENYSVDWFTPPWLVECILRVFGRIDLDPCSHPESKVPARRKVMLPEDGLSVDWKGRVYCNPPYGKGIDNWFQKAWVASQNSASVIMLGPANTASRWFQFYIPRANAACLLKGRVACYSPDPSKEVPNPTNGSVLAIYGEKFKSLFVQEFASQGWTLVRQYGVHLQMVR